MPFLRLLLRRPSRCRLLRLASSRAAPALADEARQAQPRFGPRGLLAAVRDRAAGQLRQRLHRRAALFAALSLLHEHGRLLHLLRAGAMCAPVAQHVEAAEVEMEAAEGHAHEQGKGARGRRRLPLQQELLDAAEAARMAVPVLLLLRRGEGHGVGRLACGAGLPAEAAAQVVHGRQLRGVNDDGERKGDGAVVGDESDRPLVAHIVGAEDAAVLHVGERVHLCVNVGTLGVSQPGF